MSVPHILADESSAYYHAYVLAEMSVHQTRAHFKRKYGDMVDNPKVSTACLHRLYIYFVHKLAAANATRIQPHHSEC